MTAKMKEYKKTMAADKVDDVDDDDDEIEVVDENVDPAVKNRGDGPVGTIVPNTLPIPAFLVAALMKAYSTDAATLCLAAIDAIKARADEAGEDPLKSQRAQQASYVVCWLWNVTKNRTARLHGVSIGPVANPNADEWSRNCHLRFLAERVAPAARNGPAASAANSEVWANLANALALQATDRATTAATKAAKKQGFDAFPAATQRLILFASEREEDGQVRLVPLESYKEIIELANTGHVLQHLQNHLHNVLGLDALVPTGLCAAIKVASFISVLRDRPEAFSLFSCGPQPVATTAADDDPADDILRMQLKVTDTTTGLSDKDIKKLTVVRHTLPKDFHELTTMLDNFAGITALVFGSASPITSMLRGWSRFLTKSGGTVVTSLRHMAIADKTAPSRLGWFIDRRLQQFLTACASCDHADMVDLDLFDFRLTRQAIRDGAFVYPLCPYLADKFHGRDANSTKPAAETRGPSGGQHSFGTRHANADDVVVNPRGKTAKITSKDHWQTFIDHASEAPLPGLCCRYHLNGRCKRGCHYADTHTALTDGELAAMPGWIARCRDECRPLAEQNRTRPTAEQTRNQN